MTFAEISGASDASPTSATGFGSASAGEVILAATDPTTDRLDTRALADATVQARTVDPVNADTTVQRISQDLVTRSPADLSRFHADLQLATASFQAEDRSTQVEAAPKFSCPEGSHVETRRMLTTGYDNSYQSTQKRPGDVGYGLTASGAAARTGTVAAPRTFSFGTHMYVPGYGQGTVQDRGGAIKNAHIDLWFSSTSAALAWGKRVENLQVCEPNK